MKRLGLFLVFALVAVLAVACGHQPADKGGDDGSTPVPSSTSSSGAAASAITVTITDTGLTVDNANLAEGALNFTVVNNAKAPKSVYLVPVTDIGAVPIDSDDQVDVLNPPSAGGAKVVGKIENVPAGGTRNTILVVTIGNAVVFSNDPGDFSGGKFRAELTIVAK